MINCLRQAHAALKRGGKIILIGPNIRYCSDVYWDFFDHYLPLSDRSLAEALQIVGFDIEQVIPRFLPFTMQDQKITRPIFIHLYLKLPILWSLFGRQFLIVARKTR